MQRRIHFLQGEQSPLFNLPEDLLILILKYSEKHNLRRIAAKAPLLKQILGNLSFLLDPSHAPDKDDVIILQRKSLGTISNELVKTANFKIIKMLWQKINERRDKFPMLNQTLKHKTLKAIYEKRQKSYYELTSSLATTPNHLTNKRGYTNVAII